MPHFFFKCKKIIPIVAILFFFFSCVKPEKFPPEPYLEYRSNVMYSGLGMFGDSLVLCFYFHDGDGDLGANPLDSAARNFFLIPFIKNDSGQYDSVYPPGKPDTTAIVFSYRFAALPQVNAGGSLKGELYCSITDAFFFRACSGKNIRFHAYMYDRKMNRSNVTMSTDIRMRIYR